MSTEDNKAIVRSILEALDRHDYEALKDHPGLYQTIVRQPMVRAAFPDGQTTIEQQVAEGDTVATRATIRGTQRGPFLGIPASNQQFTFSLLMMDRIVDGKIVLHHANADWLSVLVKLGVVQPPASPPKPPA